MVGGGGGLLEYPTLANWLKMKCTFYKKGHNWMKSYISNLHMKAVLRIVLLLRAEL